MSIEAMKQALEVLQWTDDRLDSVSIPNAINALRQAIAEAEKQEPVAWWNDTGTHIDLNVSGRGKPLYTHPPKREWVGLTDEEIQELHFQVKVKGMGVYRTEDIYRAVETKLKKKNGYTEEENT